VCAMKKIRFEIRLDEDVYKLVELASIASTISSVIRYAEQ